MDVRDEQWLYTNSVRIETTTGKWCSWVVSDTVIKMLFVTNREPIYIVLSFMKGNPFSVSSPFMHAVCSAVRDRYFPDYSYFPFLDVGPIPSLDVDPIPSGTFLWLDMIERGIGLQGMHVRHVFGAGVHYYFLHDYGGDGRRIFGDARRIVEEMRTEEVEFSVESFAIDDMFVRGEHIHMIVSRTTSMMLFSLRIATHVLTGLVLYFIVFCAYAGIIYMLPVVLFVGAGLEVLMYVILNVFGRVALEAICAFIVRIQIGMFQNVRPNGI